jgi:hypothetical protein
MGNERRLTKRLSVVRLRICPHAMGERSGLTPSGGSLVQGARGEEKIVDGIPAR